MTTRRSVLASAIALTLALVLAAGGSDVGAATKKKTVTKKAPTTTKVLIANGKPCTTKGAQATAGASFECVQLVSGALQWWQVGTIQNPVKLGVPVRVGSDSSGNWEVTVVGRIDNDTARVLAVDPRNALVDPTATIASVNLTIKNVGPEEKRTRFIGYVGYSRKRNAIERWTNGASLEEDCWNNETVQPGETKTCSFPYELSKEEIPQLRLGLIVDFAENPTVFMDTAKAQPPIR